MDDLSADLEGAALSIYAEAGVDPEDPPSAHELVERLVGRGRLQITRSILGGAMYQRLPDGREWVFVRPGLPPVVESMRLFHEVAERHFWGRVRDERHEWLCDQLAYRLRMPRPAFRGLVKAVGSDWRQLARPWGASETAGAMRYLEVTGRPGVVVTATDVRARGEEWAWPEAGELRRLARARHLPPEIERRRIRDRKGAVVFLAA